MIVGIVYHVEFLKLNHEAIARQIILPDYLAGACHYARPEVVELCFNSRS